MDGVAKLDELRGRLAGLSRLLGGGDTIPTAPQPPPAAKLVHAARASPPRRPSPPKTAAKQPSQPPPFKAVIPPSKSVLRSANTQPAGAVGSALAAFKQEEAKWLAQKGELQMMLNRERKRGLKLEAELKRSQARACTATSYKGHRPEGKVPACSPQAAAPTLAAPLHGCRKCISTV